MFLSLLNPSRINLLTEVSRKPYITIIYLLLSREERWLTVNLCLWVDFCLLLGKPPKTSGAIAVSWALVLLNWWILSSVMSDKASVVPKSFTLSQKCLTGPHQRRTSDTPWLVLITFSTMGTLWASSSCYWVDFPKLNGLLLGVQGDWQLSTILSSWGEKKSYISHAIMQTG